MYGEWRREWNFYKLSLTWQYKDIKASLVQMELEAGTQDDEALQVQHTSSCPLTCRAGGLVYAGQKPQWLDLDGVSWWMLWAVGREGSTTVTKVADSLFWQRSEPRVLCMLGSGGRPSSHTAHYSILRTWWRSRSLQQYSSFFRN